jgi:hypothetical protein
LMSLLASQEKGSWELSRRSGNPAADSSPHMLLHSASPHLWLTCSQNRKIRSLILQQWAVPCTGTNWVLGLKGNEALEWHALTLIMVPGNGFSPSRS